MTLIELVVGLAIAVLVLGAVGTMFGAGVRSYQARHTGSMVQAELRFALDYMARELRTATAITIISPTAISYTTVGVAHQVYLLGNDIMRLRGSELPSPLAGHVASLLFSEQAGTISITITSVTQVQGMVGTGMPLTMTTRVTRRN